MLDASVRIHVHISIQSRSRFAATPLRVLFQIHYSLGTRRRCTSTHTHTHTHWNPHWTVDYMFIHTQLSLWGDTKSIFHVCWKFYIWGEVLGNDVPSFILVHLLTERIWTHVAQNVWSLDQFCLHKWNKSKPNSSKSHGTRFHSESRFKMNYGLRISHHQ